jgi:predicted PurR-regulated permease PerM
LPGSLARSLPRHTGVAVEPTPPPRPADDVIQDLQRSGWSRWTPRRAGVPALTDWWPAYVLVIALAVLAILVTLRLAAELLGPLGHVLVIAGIACVLTFSLAPLVTRLENWMPRRAAATLVFFGTLAVLLALAAVIAWQFSGEGQRLSNQLTQLSEALKGNTTITIGPYEIPPNIQERISALTEQGTKIDEWSAAVAIGLVTSLIDLVLVLVITFYLLLDVRRLRAIVLRWLDPSHRQGARRVFSEIARVFGAYVRAQLLVALSLGVLVAAVLLALGVPYALFLALFAALAELIPMVGPVVGAVPALLVAATMPLPTVIWVGVAFVLIQLIESNILVPRMVGRAVGIHPVGSILALALGFQLGGVIGALFAVPLAGLLWVLVSTAVRAWRDKRIELQRTVDPSTVRRRRLLRRQQALARPGPAVDQP